MIKPWIAERRPMSEVERRRVLYQAVALVSGEDLLRLCGTVEYAMAFKAWLHDCRQEAEADEQLERAYHGGFVRPWVAAAACLLAVGLLLGLVPMIEGWRW